MDCGVRAKMSPKTTALTTAAGPAAAHPHVWIDVHYMLNLDEAGAIDAIAVHWTFDEFYSVFAVDGLDADGDGRHAPEELAPLAAENIRALEEWSWFTMAEADGDGIALDRVGSWHSSYQDGRLALAFLGLALAAAAGAALGLPSDAVHGGMSPEQKRDFVLRMQDEGHKVAMLGDGVNDAAALKTANVGIAVGGGASASYAAADVFLMKEGLSPVRSLLDGADTSMRTVHRNLAFSLLYNMVGAAAAIAGFVTPLLRPAAERPGLAVAHDHVPPPHGLGVEVEAAPVHHGVVDDATPADRTPRRDDGPTGDA